jgi:GntR family transcriptional regulator
MEASSSAMRKSGPLTQQIVTDLRRRILDGEFGEAGKLPSESAVQERYGVSRIVARNAYSALIELGLVTTQERRGYYVHLIKPIVIQLGGSGGSDLLALDEWESAAVAQGRNPRTEVQVRVLGGHDPAPAEVAERLGLGQDDLVVLRDRICFVDDVPFMLRPSYFPEPLARGTVLMGAGPGAGAPGLLEAAGRPGGKSDDYLRARMASPDEAARLQLPRVTPCIEWMRTSYDGQGAPVSVSQSLLPGDRVALSGCLG